MYRIKIEEKNNGKTRYIPQVGIPRLRIGKFNFLSVNWENIISRNDWNYYTSSTSMSESYDKEEDALFIVEKYKEYLLVEEGDKIKSTTYKIID